MPICLKNIHWNGSCLYLGNQSQTKIKRYELSKTQQRKQGIPFSNG